jgi:CheY-like chemotaxis protein/HPt (histidine-containing phosphotransfer) domain-containing protein
MSKTVLIADDVQVSLILLDELMSAYGFTNTLCVDGTTAISGLGERKFDLILLDQQMPGAYGSAVLRRVRESVEHINFSTPAIALSAELDAEMRVELEAAGFKEIMAKPFVVDEFYAAVSRCINETARTTEPGKSVIQDLPDQIFDDAAGVRTTGSLDVLRRIRQLLAAELPQVAAHTNDYFAQKQWRALRDELHKLRASAGLCGAVALINDAVRLREDIITQNANLPATFARFQNTLSATLAALTNRHLT